MDSASPITPIILTTDRAEGAGWHLGQLEWAQALRSGGIMVRGAPSLRRALPTWKRRPELGKKIRGSVENRRSMAELVYSVTDSSTPDSA